MLILVSIGALLAIIGFLTYHFAPRVGPNPFFGVRVGYSFASREVWDRSNRVGGALIAATGVGVIFLAFVLRLFAFDDGTAIGIATIAMLVALFGEIIWLGLYARRIALETNAAREIKPVKFRWAYLFPVLATFALLILLAAYFFPLLPPDRIATHFDQDGQPNDWMPRALFYLTMLGLGALFILINSAVVVIATREPLIAIESWGSRWQLTPKRGLLYLGLSLALGNLVLALVFFDIGWFNTFGSHPFPIVVFIIITFLLLAILVALFFVLGRNESEQADNLKRLKPWFIRDGRLRSGWRIAAYLGSSFILLFIWGILFLVVIGFVLASRGLTPAQIEALIEDFSRKPFNYPDLAVVFEILRLLFAMALIWVFRRRIDQRSVRDLGFQLTDGWWHELGAGFAFVIVAWCAIFLLTLAFGTATVVGFAWDARDFGSILAALLLGLMFNLCVGIVEESDARGYILQNLAKGIRLIPAIAASSLYFGALHLLNPGAGWLSTLGVFVAGILLATGYYVTGRLWFSIGMHAAWNFAEGPIFGFPVSGLDMGGLFQLKINGPEWLIGGTFGPEAGALAVVVEIAMIGILLYWMQSHTHKINIEKIRVYLRSILK